MKIKYLYQLIKNNWPGIKEGFRNTKIMWIFNFILFICAVIIITLTTFFPQWAFFLQTVSLVIAFIASIFLMIFAYQEYTRSSRELDNLLKEYEKDTSKFDFSFPNEFIRGIYNAEGLRGSNVDFVKKIYFGVEHLDITQKRIALIYIRNYNNNSPNIFSSSSLISILPIVVSMLSIIGFAKLKSYLFALGFLFFYGFAIILFIYRVNQKKTYICSVLEDTLKYLLEQEK